mmetsp:Transcript_95604/g.274403  ORF Transcript_95604/g.274403 Transcript_95604/m.274403 type:complete len:275 (+) Transcript_95604:215-1039(+)
MPNRIDAGIRVDRPHQSSALEQILNRNGLLLERDEPLADRLDVVVAPAARLPTLQEPLLHDRLRALDEEHELNVGFVAQQPVPSLVVVKAAGEAVNQILAALPTLPPHFFLDEAHGDLRGNQFTLRQAALDKLSHRRSGSLPLGPDEVAGAEVLVAELLHGPRGEGALAGAGPAEHEHHLGAARGGSGSGPEALALEDTTQELLEGGRRPRGQAVEQLLETRLGPSAGLQRLQDAQQQCGWVLIRASSAAELLHNIFRRHGESAGQARGHLSCT